MTPTTLTGRLLAIGLLLGTASLDLAADNTNPAATGAAAVAAPAWAGLPTSYAESETKGYDMADVDLILENSVLFTGRSDRRIPKRAASARTGTRFSLQNPNVTRLEGNRVMFHMFQDGHREFIDETLDRLQTLPSKKPLATLSRDAQLAYWLNLRNLAVLKALADAYPRTKLEDFIFAEDGVLHQKNLTVLGYDLSVRDIEDYLIATYEDPRIFYGFYYGVVGGPNIRTSAFRAKDVWTKLEDNATDFVNSLRGVRRVIGGEAQISELYAMYPALFGGEQSLLDHLSLYAEDTLLLDMRTATSVKAKISDWYVADLVNGKTSVSASQLLVQTRDGQVRDSAQRSIPEHARVLLRDIQAKNRRYYRDRQAQVEVYETQRGTSAEPVEQTEGTEDQDGSGNF